MNPFFLFKTLTNDMILISYDNNDSELMKTAERNFK